MANNIIEQYDSELYRLLCQEEQQQKNNLNMIASESYQDEVSLAILGSAFCNKTAVGLPGEQRLGGSAIADELEKLAARRACALFGAEHANILPYSGTVANLCIYQALLEIGDTVVALDPEQGSHASHGRKAHISGQLYHFVHFGLDSQTLLFSYDILKKTVKEHHPKLVVIGVSAYSRNIDYKRVAQIAHAEGAYFMVDMAHTSGLVAAGVLENPVPYADVVAASATKTMCGCHTGYISCKAAIANKIDGGVYPGVTASVHLQTVAAAAYAMKKAGSAEFRQRMWDVVVNAKTLAEALIERGFGIVTGGTDCHMMVIDLRPLGIDGKTFYDRMERIGISANTKKIPYDEAAIPNGIRVGTIIPTQMGMGTEEMHGIAEVLKRIAQSGNDETIAACRAAISTMIADCRKTEP